MTAFRIFIILFALIPLYFGVTGVFLGAAQLMEGMPFTQAMDNQFRYLSGVYIGISMILFYCAGDVVGRALLFRGVVLAVFIGGVARAISYLTVGTPPPEQVFGMGLELMLPLSLLWQARVIRVVTRS
ncbi:hypothetical protein MNBD_ALPHA04-2243 [hydrothermal vent metagenome]|uniref:DUF4345 domain-containing protein n=1 Tax=hydrothermal vent metagenome TaxID=652676 RepID=A0A3B0RIT9_9ZZZZ